MSFGSKIKELRIEKGLTQKQLGELCGMADSAIRRYESDRGNPTMKTLLRFASAHNVPIEVLYFDNISYKDIEKWIGTDNLVENEKVLLHGVVQEECRTTLEHRDKIRTADFCNSVNGRTIIAAYYELNKAGQAEAVKNILTLTENQQYQDYPSQNQVSQLCKSHDKMNKGD